MTREEAMKAALVMKAYSEGKTIQYRNRSANLPWSNIYYDPSFDWTHFEYRTKPVTLKFRNALAGPDSYGTAPTVRAVYPADYRLFEGHVTFIKWIGEEQEVEVE